MGDACDQALCERFIKEFGEELLAKYRIELLGHTNGQQLSWDNDYRVRLFIILLDDNDDERELMENQVLYSPHWDWEVLTSELYSTLAHGENIEDGTALEKRIEERLKRADLVP